MTAMAEGRMVAASATTAPNAPPNSYPMNPAIFVAIGPGNAFAMANRSPNSDNDIQS